MNEPRIQSGVIEKDGRLAAWATLGPLPRKRPVRVLAGPWRRTMRRACLDEAALRVAIKIVRGTGP